MATLKTLNGQDVISGSGRTVYPDTKGNNIYQGKVKPKQEYYTCAQGKVYINEILLDEAYDIMYSYRELKEPIYGYNSKYYDAIVPGTVIIYGSFTINYKHDSYLAKTLAKTELKGVGSSLSDNELKRLFEKKNEAEKKARDYLRDVSLVKASLGSRQEKEIELALLSKEKEAFEKEKLAAEEAYGDTLRKYAEEQDRVAADKKKFIEDLKNSDIESYGKLNKANQELS